MSRLGKMVLWVLMGLCVAGNAWAATVNINEDIDESTTWTSDNEYQLNGSISVLPGATLTIEAGTVVKSLVAEQGSLAVTRGAKIYVNGNKDNPVIMTSENDNMTGWHVGASEWGSLAIMGDAFISQSHYANVQTFNNTDLPTGLNEAQMEGLTPANSSDTTVRYGGDNDDDDSGAIHYLSLRYGGKVKDVADELNGMSLGGVGRATDIDHVEVMNNVDDGIEIFGGTVNLKYVNIWNVGDDAFDVDQGWRGKAQFGLIVQGYSADASQGSGVSDNCFETDGAEESDAQPVTTAAIYHFTAIGQPDPNGGDRATAWRDGARVQYRNCIFMDIGERLVNNDFSDGTPDGHAGYGHNGTLSFDATWTTPYTHSHDLNSTVNGCDEITGGCSQGGIKNLPTELYQAQTSGNLSEIRDSVFYNLTGGLGHAPVDLMSGFDNVNATGLPIRNLVRGPLVTPGGKNIYPVTMLDPRANSPEANTSVATAPADGFFTQANFRGAFSPHYNWLEGWTAVDAYNMTDTTDNPPEPSATINMTATTFFQTTAGISYTVEESDDMLTWTPVATIVGDGTIKSVTDLDEFDNAKFYRVIVT